MKWRMKLPFHSQTSTIVYERMNNFIYTLISSRLKIIHSSAGTPRGTLWRPKYPVILFTAERINLFKGVIAFPHWKFDYREDLLGVNRAVAIQDKFIKFKFRKISFIFYAFLSWPTLGTLMTSAAADVINHNGRKIGRFKPRRFW